MAMLNPMMTTDVAGSPCWMRPGGWTQVGFLKTRGCMGSVVKPHKWLLLKRPWEFVKELFRTYLIVSYMSWLARDLGNMSVGSEDTPALMMSYFEQLLNGLVYEIFFPDELHAHTLFLF